MNGKSFDLNIEQILENWEVRHAVREVIANALDEQILTGTSPVDIEKREHIWFIRDYGRGLKYTHLTQNENQEKLVSSNVIGRFGIGLKDALATFERHGVEVHIRSRYGTIKTTKMVKQGFGDIVTLHAIIEDPNNTEFVGTEFEMRGVDDNEMEAAKKLFLIFSGERILDTTRYGQVITKHSDPSPGCIYINGVKVAEESNFLFSYNVTLLNAAIKKAINRERSHVGRTAYADSVKKILLASSNTRVAEQLSKDIAVFHEGTMHDELAWVDVQEHAIKILNTQGNVIMVTAAEAMSHPDLMDQAQNSGLTVITIPENLRAKIADSVDLAGNRIVDLAQFTQNYNDGFVFSFVDPSELNSSERAVFDTLPWIITTFGGKPNKVGAIRISNTMRPDLLARTQTLGCWDPSTDSIVIWREQLKSLSAYAGILLHELTHAKTGHQDVTRDFESALTEILGDICAGWYSTIQHQMVNELKPKMPIIQPIAPVDGSIVAHQLKAAWDQIETLRYEKSITEGRLADACSTIEHLRECEKELQLKADQLASDMKQIEATARQISTSSSSGVQKKTWYQFW